MKYILFILLYIIIGIIFCSIWIILDNKYSLMFGPGDGVGYAMTVIFWPLCFIIFVPIGIVSLLGKYFEWLHSL